MPMGFECMYRIGVHVNLDQTSFQSCRHSELTMWSNKDLRTTSSLYGQMDDQSLEDLYPTVVWNVVLNTRDLGISYSTDI